jgi:hypothetical protein
LRRRHRRYWPARPAGTGSADRAGRPDRRLRRHLGLPQSAELLASTAICANQASSLGQHAVEIAATPGISPAALRRDTERFAPNSASRGEACLSEWLAALYDGRK